MNSFLKKGSNMGKEEKSSKPIIVDTIELLFEEIYLLENCILHLMFPNKKIDNYDKVKERLEIYAKKKKHIH